MDTRTLTLTLTLTLAGCLPPGPATTTRGCDFRQTATSLRFTCVDYDDFPSANADALGKTCSDVSHGVWLSAPCDHAGALGGCRVPVEGAGFDETLWWWAGAQNGAITDVASAQKACVDIEGRWIQL